MPCVFLSMQLLRLKERGLLEDVNMTSQRNISVHDLYREFAKLESQGKLNESADFENRKWVYFEDTSPTELEMTPSHRCWQKLIRIGIEESRKDGQQHLLHTLQGIEWQNCSNVVVLRLEGLKNLRGDLNFQGLKCLRSLELIDIFKLDSLDGLQDLNHLTYFRWTHLYNFDDNMSTRMGQLPASLRVVQLCLGFFLSPDAFSRCSNLCKLELYACRVEHLDFSNCKSLQTAKFQSLKTLETLSGLPPNLQSLQVWTCKDLVGIPGLGDLVGLQVLYLHGNPDFQKLPDLHKLTRLQVLKLTGMGSIEEVPGLGCLWQLRDLQCRDLSRCRLKLPNLCALKQLAAVDFSANDGLSSLEGVLQDLSALRCLDLTECGLLTRLPDLRGMSSLEELDLRGSGVEIGEEDFCMLATLPLLHPVRIGRRYMQGYLRLDVVRRKVLKWVQESYQTRTSGDAWVAWTRWEERDLGMLPIQVQDLTRW